MLLKALQARIDLHQSILKEYRTRGYQMVLAHVGLVVALGKYAIDRTPTEQIAVGLAGTVVTGFLWDWLRRLKDKSDGHRDDALQLYERLGVGIDRDREHKESRYRLWSPLVKFPWAVLVGLWIWLLAPKLPAMCQVL